MIDLHTHTTYSDGTFTPKELMEYAKLKKIEAIAVTDHDTTDGLEQSLFFAEKNGIEFIPGIEISTTYENKEYHILGFFIDKSNSELIEFIEECNHSRNLRTQAMIALFNENGVPMSIDELYEISPNGRFNRMHFANLLFKKKIVDSTDEAFKNYLRKGCKTFLPVKLPHPKEAFEKIINSGGIPVLAHPVNYKLSAEKLDEILAYFKEIGLAGIEAIYSTNSEDDEKLFIEMAEKHDLLITGGSDFHGKNKPSIDLGCGKGNLNIGCNILENLKKYKNEG